jgi:hypothetical protein
MSTRLQQSLLLRPLQTPDDLHRWVRLFCNVNVPRAPVCPAHTAPFDYLVRAYFEPATDQVVHAPRGGGKTRLAAIATLLDLLHKPGISVRILGGSLEQSLRMWEHLVPDLNHAARELIKKRIGNAKRITLGNGSNVAVLTQSERSVRGLRVQKLRCDEVELFKPEVWKAAQLVTKSQTSTNGAIDALSTLHQPFGLMQKIIDDAQRVGTPIVRWCLLDVLERCPADRDCASCALFEDCGGAAKTRANGFVTIDDAVRMKKRVSLEVWQSEMLCRWPSVTRAVFPSFAREVHVRESVAFGSNATTSLAIDFGFANPFVCLWLQTDGAITHVVDEYVQDQRTIDEHIVELRARQWPSPSQIACDPAGSGRNEQTGLSSVQQLRRAGFVVRHRSSRIVDGVERVRAALRPAAGEPTLFVHPRCKHLIRSLMAYRYGAVAGGASELPVKDGEHDHLIDALRYHYVNASRSELAQRTY